MTFAPVKKEQSAGVLETPPRKHVLFVCVENATRTPMAAAFARRHGRGLVEAFSAGSRPVEAINPRTVAAMAELNYDLADYQPRSIDDLPADVEWDAIVTIGRGAQNCPATLRTKQRLDWNLPDPRHMDAARFATVRDLIEAHVKFLLAEL